MISTERFALFRNPEYGRLFVSTVLTKIGYWLTFVGLYSLFTFDHDIGPLAIGAFAAVAAVPKLFGSPVLGVLADRFDRKRIVILSELFGAVLVGILVFHQSLAFGYVVFFVLGLLSSVAGPALKAMIPQIVDEEDVSRANGLIITVRTITMLLGPMIAGVLLTLVDVEMLFIIDAVTYLLSGIVLFGMTSYSVEASDDSFGTDFFEGLTYMRASSIVLTVTVAGTITFATIGVFEGMLPYYVREILARDGSTYGYVLSFVAVGSFLASFGIGIVGDLIDQKTDIAIGMFINGLGMLIYAMFPTVLATYAASVLTGIGTTWVITISYSALQRSTKEEYTGRVLGAFSGVTQAGSLLGILAGGLLTSTVGVLRVFTVTGAIATIIGVGSIVRFAIMPTPHAERPESEHGD